MIGERTLEGWQLRLKPRGADRYVSGGFLAFWLCGWAAGEAFALWFLITGAKALLTGKPPGAGHEPISLVAALAIGGFLLVWLTLWTIGGIAALSELFRLLWGEDRITVSSGRLTVSWIRGPFRGTRSFDRDRVRGFALNGRADALVLETASGHVELSRLGTRDDRREAAVELRSELGVLGEASPAAATIPNGWEQIITPEGERVLVSSIATRRTQARVASIAALAMAGVTFLIARQAAGRWDLLIPAFICLVFTVGLTVGTLWLARGRWEWRIGSGRLTLRKRYGSSLRDVFEARRLMVDQSSDSDGDPWYVLYAMSEAPDVRPAGPIQWRTVPPKNSRTIARVMNDATGVRQLAAWLARETSLPLEDRSTPEARQIQLAELRALLENHGRFGKWAARLVDRLSERNAPRPGR